MPVDRIFLPFDPLTADANFQGKVDMTFVGGNLVYEQGTEGE